MTELHWTEIDHVPTLWVDAPAPFRAGLLFRTGRIDETLATAGQNHLIEHMALSSLNETAQQHNGFVGGAMTGFFTMGQPQEVCSFMARICAALTHLPGDRLEEEKQVLAAENAARAYDFRSNLLMWRYGAAGYGLIGMAELGLRRATLQQLHEYGAQRFTNGNAILWLSGPPPADLHLRLPNGSKQPLPPLAPVQQTIPSWFVDNMCGGIVAGAIVSRVSASSVFSEIASRRLRKRLRTDQAVSYAPAVFYDHLNSNTAHLVLYADSDKGRRAELVNGFSEVFKGLEEIHENEIEDSRRQIGEYWTGTLAPPPTDRMLIEAQRAAMDWILGKEFESMERLHDQLLSVTAEDVLAFAHEVQATAMFALPGEATLQPCFGKQSPFSSAPVVQGHEVLSADAPILKERLVHGPDGVSILFPNGSHCTVRYSGLAAAFYYEDGCVSLIGSDAAAVTVEPTLWQNGHSICRKIREQIPEHLLVDQRSRPANAIPKPSTTAWQRFYARLAGR